MKKILINTTGEIPTPSGCPPGTLITTDYPDLYLINSQQDVNFPHLKPTTLRLDYAINALSDYSMFVMEQQLQTLQNDFRSNMCSNRFEHLSNNPFKLNEEKYGLIVGQVIYSFSCIKKTTTIRSSPYCFDKIPVNGGFVDPVSNIFTKHGAKQACNENFPMIVQANEAWIALHPAIKPTIQPEVKPPTTIGLQHTDMSRGGIYTTDEMQSWEDLISFPQFHESVLKTFTSGTCDSDASCNNIVNSGMQQYDLRRLTDTSDVIWNPLKPLQDWVEEYGVYLSAFIILVWVMQLLVALTTVLFTLLKEGYMAALAVLFTIFCGPKQALDNVKKNKRKELKRRERAEEQPLREVRPKFTFRDSQL